MPKKLKVNYTKLIKAVESGKPSKEIMDEFGIKTSVQLKATYLDALISKGKAPSFSSRRGSESANKQIKSVLVNKRGSIVIPQKMVTEFGFSEGDVFTVRKTKSGVNIKKI